MQVPSGKKNPKYMKPSNTYKVPPKRFGNFRSQKKKSQEKVNGKKSYDHGTHLKPLPEEEPVKNQKRGSPIGGGRIRERKWGQVLETKKPTAYFSVSGERF